MEATFKKLPKSSIECKISIPYEEVIKETDKACKLLANKIEIKGFRKGKASKEVLEQHVGKQRIFEEAGYLAIEKAYMAAVREHKLKIIGQPNIAITKFADGNTLEFTATAALMPEITLPDYKKIAKKVKENQKPEEVSDKDMEQALIWLQKSRSKEKTVARSAQKGDKVEIDFETKVAGVKIENGDSTNHPFVLGEGKFMPGFEDNIIGAKIGEQKTFSLEAPPDYFHEPLRGKQVDFSIKIKNIYEIETPILDDVFAKSLGEFENIDALKESIKKNLQGEKQQADKEKLRKAFAEAIAKEMKVEVPDILITQEVKKMISEMEQNIKNHGVDIEQYLVSIKKTRDDLKEDFSKDGEVRVKIALALSKIVKEENISISEEEIKERTETILARYKEKQNVDAYALRDYVSGIIQNEKVFSLLLEKDNK